MFSAFVLTFEWLSIWPSAFKTTITVIALWISMPTYLILFMGRLLAVGNLKKSLFKTTTCGVPFLDERPESGMIDRGSGQLADRMDVAKR
jgi:hypothetical protein